jgi:Thioesterase-like superfamily
MRGGSVRFVQSCFYEPAGPDEFIATAATIGPWSRDAQHGGPPSALAARALEACDPVPGQRLASVTIDILRPVPVGKLCVRARAVRPGRRVMLVEATVEADGQEVLHARGWRIQAGPVPETPGRVPPPPVPGEESAVAAAGLRWEGYGTTMEWRFVSGGGIDVPGPGAAWMRPRVPLLPGEETSPMCRALLVADSGNGVSAVLDVRSYVFINVNLSVMLHRDPAGEWLLMDAVTAAGPDGTGVATSILSDTAGPVGRGMQALLVAPR